MRNYLYVFAGGAVGGLMRVMATRAENVFTFGGMDLTILLVNVTGAFLLGIFLSGITRFKSIRPGLYLSVAVGFCGSFTTFSTLCLEATGLLQSGAMLSFALYIFASCVLGLGGAQLGFRAGQGNSLLWIGKQNGKILGIGLQDKALPPVTQEAEVD